MRRLIILTLFATNLAHAQLNACAPGLNPAALERANVATQRCGIKLQSYLYESGDLRGDISIGLDADDAIRIAQNTEEQPFAVVFPAGVTHAGRDGDTIYWGIWNTRDMLKVAGDRVETSRGTAGAMPYVAGVASRSLPSGVVHYRLAGAPFMVSGHVNAYAPERNADHRGSPIDPGPISQADLAVDFGAGTATLNLRFTVRGVAGAAVIELRRRERPSLEFEAVECDNPATCAQAKLNFYGSGATHAGVLLTVYYERVMPEPGRVAATLSNVSGSAAIGLRRR